MTPVSAKRGLLLLHASCPGQWSAALTWPNHEDQPTSPTRAIKRLRPNPLAEFELRVGDLRVLYNVEEAEVVRLVGYSGRV